MRQYAMTASEAARTLTSGGSVPASEVPLIHSAISVRRLSLADVVGVDAEFADRYGIGRAYRSMATLALHMGCPMVGANPVEWLIRETRALWEAKRN